MYMAIILYLLYDPILANFVDLASLKLSIY